MLLVLTRCEQNHWVVVNSNIYGCFEKQLNLPLAVCLVNVHKYQVLSVILLFSYVCQTLFQSKSFLPHVLQIMFKLVNARQFQDAANVFADAERQFSLQASTSASTSSSSSTSSHSKSNDRAFSAITLIPAITSLGRLRDVAGVKRLLTETLPAFMHEEQSIPSPSMSDSSSIDDSGGNVDGDQSESSTVNSGVPKSLLRSILHSAVSAFAAASHAIDGLTLFDAMPNAPWHCPHDTVSIRKRIAQPRAEKFAF